MHSRTFPEPFVELPDVNVLIALYFPNHERHQAALEWLRDVSQFATTPITETGFLRLTTNKTIFQDAVLPRRALVSLTELRAHPKWEFWPDRTSLTVPRISTAPLLGSKQVTDFHLVNLAATHPGVLATFDSKLLVSLRTIDRKYVRIIPT
ncbi:MAG: hypothetical protein FWG25_01595 [Promicromonosporaceae bacterium]|nr:hypothetical protein [Promicromonosporaceae bacterium]